MTNIETYPGDNAIRKYLRRIMSDGRWRTSNDIVSRAKRDGMAMTAQSAGYHMSRLAEAGDFLVDGRGERMMWKLRRTQQEAAE